VNKVGEQKVDKNQPVRYWYVANFS